MSTVKSEAKKPEIGYSDESIESPAADPDLEESLRIISRGFKRDSRLEKTCRNINAGDSAHSLSRY